MMASIGGQSCTAPVHCASHSHLDKGLLACHMGPHKDCGLSVDCVYTPEEVEASLNLHFIILFDEKIINFGEYHCN